MRIRFAGESLDIAVDALVATTPRLRALREGLADVRLANGERLGRPRAQTLVERLLVVALDDFGVQYMRAMGEHIDAIARLRGEIRQRFEGVLGHFSGGGTAATAPAGMVDVGAIETLFAELDHHLEAIDQNTGEHSLEGGRYLRDNPDVRSRDPEDAFNLTVDEASAEQLAEGEDVDYEPPEHEPVDPDLDLDDVEAATPWWLGRGEADPAAAGQYRDMRDNVRGRTAGDVELLPPLDAARARLEVVLAGWASHAVPSDWRVSLQLQPGYTEATAAALAETSVRDVNYAANHFEVRFAPPEGRVFLPDGVRYLDGDGNRYLFMEHKEPPDAVAIARFTSPESREALKRSMIDDARIAEELEPYGCQGWVYSTGSPEVARMMTEIIAELRAEGGAFTLGRFLHAPEVRGR